MRIHYDPRADAAYIRLAETEIVESDEVTPGVILDFDAQGNVIAIEILDASKFGRNVRDLHFEILTREAEAQQ